MMQRRAITEEELKEIREVRQANDGKRLEKRLRALEMYAEGKSHKEISNQTGYSMSYIPKLGKKYLVGGLSAIVDNHYKGNHRLLSVEEEAEVLAPFMEKAELGQVVEVSEIKVAYEKEIGRELNSNGHIYEVLKRHNLRKVMPRSKHPNKACDEVIHITKKLKQLARK